MPKLRAGGVKKEWGLILSGTLLQLVDEFRGVAASFSGCGDGTVTVLFTRHENFNSWWAGNSDNCGMYHDGWMASSRSFVPWVWFQQHRRRLLHPSSDSDHPVKIRSIGRNIGRRFEVHYTRQISAIKVEFRSEVRL